MTTPYTLASLQGRMLIKSAATARNPFFTQAKQIGKMFNQNKDQTNGGSIIAGARNKSPMSMNEIALQKREQDFGRDQKKFQDSQAELQQQQQAFALQQQHERHKLEIEKMLSKSEAPSVNMLPQPEMPRTHEALGGWAKRLGKDLQRLVVGT